MKQRIKLKDIIEVLIPAIVVALLLKYVFFVSTINSGSMEPTLMTGNLVVFNRLAYQKKEVERGDIIAFKEKETGRVLGKRVIGLAGDKIGFIDGYVVINGILFDETEYLAKGAVTYCDKTFEVPEGCVFLLGDNRENSFDSRFWEEPYISEEQIVGPLIWQLHL